MFFKSSPRRYFFGHCRGKFSGANLYWERFIGCRRGFLYGKSYIFARKTRGRKFSFVSLAFLKIFSSKGRLCTVFCGENFGSIMVRFSGLGILVGV